MKLIERFSISYRSTSIGAGVYGTFTTATHQAKFNLIVKSVQIGCSMEDSVTGQAINGTIRPVFTMTGLLDDNNPGIIAQRASMPIMMSSAGRMDNADFYFGISTGEILTLTIYFNLYSVTANAIDINILWKIKYLCPEDYLGFDLFAAKMS